MQNVPYTRTSIKGVKLAIRSGKIASRQLAPFGTARAAKRINMVHPIIEGLRSSGIDSLTRLANALNERGIKTGQAAGGIP